MDEIERAQLDLIPAISQNIAYINPPDEHHFDPATFVFAFAGMLLYAFAKGFVKELQTRSEDSGKAAADKIYNLGKQLLAKNKEKQKEEVKSAVGEVTAASAHLPKEEIERVTKIAQNTVENVLLANDFPPEKADNLAQQVSDSMTRLISGHGTK